MMNTLLRWFPLLFGLVLLSGKAGAEEGLELFESRIRPVLVQHCYECHSTRGGELQGNLSLETRPGLLRGGDSGPAVVPGKPEESLLLAALRYESFEMPPKQRLPANVIADFVRWIELGAPDPRTQTALVAPRPKLQQERHWSLQPIGTFEPPQVESAEWSEHPIDRFVRARMLAAGVEPVGLAKPEHLLRRVHFDLVGLPPTPEQVREFLADPSEEHYRRIVDELLASPHFGERWGRHWLDLARFAESNGGDRNVVHPHAWRYRRYVIAAFNADKPFDCFLQEQLAGDLLPAESPRQRDEQLIATGFLTLGSKLFMEPKAERFRMDVIDEQIDVLSRSVLGMSMSCARCHDHKFDPISMKDYYATAGILQSTELLYGSATPGNEYGHDRPLQPVGENAEQLHGPALKWKEEVATAIAVRNKARADRYRVVRAKAAEENKLQMMSTGKSPEEIAADPALQELQEAIARQDREIKEWDEKIKQLDEALQKIEASPPPFPDYAMAVREAEKLEDCRLRIRGQHDQLSDPVPRGVPTFLTASAEAIPPEQSGRLQLARWLTSPENPLTARVAVNRLWQHLMGEGLVRSVDNFGVTGERPSHPELLDDLAARFQQQGWSMKTMIREIVLSRSYRLASVPQEGNQQIDPENRLLWKANGKRLEAEVLRDALLMVSGELELQPPEQSVMAEVTEPEFNDRVQLTAEQISGNYRAVYLPVVRQSTSDLFKAFSFPDPALLQGQRSQRVMPDQQLFFLNSSFVEQRAERAAARLLSLPEVDPAARIRWAYLLFLGREPSSEELQQVGEFLAEEQKLLEAQAGTAAEPMVSAEHLAWARFCQVLYASAEFRQVR